MYPWVHLMIYRGGRSEEEEMGTVDDLGCEDHWIGVFDEVEWNTRGIA